MRRTQGNVARKEWYDRNPVGKNQVFQSNGEAPHAGTNRWQYTVASGKKAMVTFIFGRVVRVTAAVTPGAIESVVLHNDGTNQQVWNTRLESNKNTVGDFEQTSVGSTLFADTGDVITGQTSDASDTGSVAYWNIAAITEFDA